MISHESILPMRRPAVVAFCMDILRNEGPSAFYKGKEGVVSTRHNDRVILAIEVHADRCGSRVR